MRDPITNEQFKQIEDLIKNEKLSVKKACEKVGLGISTYYHRKSKQKPQAPKVTPKRAYVKTAEKKPASPYTITTVVAQPKEDRLTAVIGSPAVIAEFLKELLS